MRSVATSPWAVVDQYRTVSIFTQFFAIKRADVSDSPSAANPTIMVMGLLGISWAKTYDAKKLIKNSKPRCLIKQSMMWG
jgi:hypothetical protein